MRRKIIGILCFLTTLLTCLQILKAQDKKKPNIVLIMADDVSWECFGIYGSEEYNTPNIDKLANNGLLFKHCYSTPLCTPSRVKLMTGKYNFRNYTHFGYLHPNEKTFGHMMQEAGYKTAIAGKWQLNGLYHQAEKCEDNTRPYKAGFDEYCLWQLTKGAHGENGGERFWSPLLEQNGKLLTKEDNHKKYGPDIMSDFVCNFIKRNANNPFFVYYPSVLVHDPFVPTPNNIGIQPKTHVTNKEPKDYKSKKANFVAMVEYLDNIVGKIVRQLEEVRQLDNTLIIFTADNGTNVKITSEWNGMTIKGGKGNTTDMGTHVPLIVSWKGKTPKGKVINDLIDFSDFYATLADAINSKMDNETTQDSRSFFPQIIGQKGNPREWQFNHYQPYWGNFYGRQYVRNHRYKLYRDSSFYNISKDLKEENNIIEKLNKKDRKAYNKLIKVIRKMPPAPPLTPGNKQKDRPIYPNWVEVIDN